MNKAIKVIEKNAEWIALGAAAAWIGWISWGYFMNAPTKTLESQTLGPADIDRHIAETNVRTLLGIMDNATKIELTNPQVDEIFPPIPPSRMPLNLPVSSVPPKNPIKFMDMGIDTKADVLISVLPSIPAPTISLWMKGLSQVQIQTIAAAPTAPVRGAPAQVATLVNLDKVWTTVFASINDKAILEEYKKVKIAEALQDRRYMRVELERTEMYDGRMVGPGEVVKQLPMNLPPYDPIKEWDLYRQWLEPQAGTNEVLVGILQPSFYQIIKGDGWTFPPVLNGIYLTPVASLADAQDPLSVKSLIGPLAQARPAVRPREQAPTALGVIQQFMRPTFAMDANGNFLIWQHDDSAADGKTYVYRIRVVMKNPLYQNSRAVEKVMSVLEIPGKWSEYSSPVALPSRMKWFVRSANVPNGTIRIKAVKFDQGEMNQSNEITAAIGDIVGGLESEKSIDYSTGWVLADIRQIGTSDRSVDTRITLMNAQGQTIVRWLKQEQAEYNTAYPATRPVDPNRAVLPSN